MAIKTTVVSAEEITDGDLIWINNVLYLVLSLKIDYELIDFYCLTPGSKVVVRTYFKHSELICKLV